MRALQITGAGEPLHEVALDPGRPGPGEVSIAIGAAGICRSDVHYRAGTRPPPSLPLVPGHEVAGTVQAVGAEVSDMEMGDRVCLHYLVTCGSCAPCRRGAEQFCETGQMIGLDRQGGYAESITVPAPNAHPIPDGVSTAAAAVMMCSTATSLHALRRGRTGAGAAVALFGVGGLGMSAIQLALLLGADPVYAVDVNPAKLKTAESMGAVPVDGGGDAVAALRTAGGVDVALELVGSPQLMADALTSLAPGGRAVAVGLTHGEFGLDPYRDLIRPETELIGSADHLDSEIDELLHWAAAGSIDVEPFVTRQVPLDVDEVNATMDRLESFGDDIRTVIVPAED